ncbi:MAG: hypothetical protein M3P49_07695 [Actinomycetota bacterium]|nr:hypothetical protein [Actinomycetota bacterium]
MARQSLARERSKNSESRAQRGVELHRAVREAIESLGGGKYLVPSARTSEVYEVDIYRDACTCYDAPRAKRLGERCKHSVAAEIRNAELRRALLDEREAYVATGLRLLKLVTWRRGLKASEEEAVVAALDREALKPAGERESEEHVAISTLTDVRIEESMAREAEHAA